MPNAIFIIITINLFTLNLLTERLQWYSRHKIEMAQTVRDRKTGYLLSHSTINSIWSKECRIREEEGQWLSSQKSTSSISDILWFYANSRISTYFELHFFSNQPKVPTKMHLSKFKASSIQSINTVVICGF